MSKKNKRFTRIFSLTMALVMLLPSQAVAYYLAEELTSLWDETIYLQDGSTLSLSETESWEAVYPQGIFALSNESVMLGEGDDATITVYRLGGADGKAVAYFGYEPTIYAEEDGVTPNYSMAISDEDITLYIEENQPMTDYQSIGGNLKTSEIAVEQSEAVEVEEDGETLSEITLSAPADLVYDAIQWYVYGTGIDFEKIDGAIEDTLVVVAEDLNTYDFRFTYEVEGITYVSVSTNDVVYEEVTDYEGEIPEDVPLWAEQSFLPLTMDGEDPYSGYAFAMEFADGEYVKEIKLSALDDALTEALESATLTLYFSKGADIFTGAEKLIVSIEDDEPVIPADISIDVESITVDKSDGTAYIPVVRTGGTSYALTVDYATVDGTALAGKDYSATSGTLLFYAGIDTINIEVELIDDKIETADTVDFTVELSNLLGDGDAPSTITNDTATVSLYNSNTATEENFATMMYDGSVDDVSAQISEGTAAATVGQTVIGGTQNVIDSGATTMASASFAWNTGSDNSFAVTAANVGTTGDWVEYSSRLGYNASVSTEGDGWFYYVDYYDYTTTVKLGGEFGFGGDTITLDNDPTKYQYYDYMRLTGELTTGYKSQGIFDSWGGVDAVTQPYINVTSTSGNVATYAGSTGTDKTYSETFNADFYLGYNGYDSYTTITAGQNSLKGSSLDDAYSYFWYIMNLNRREFSNTDNFVIVTANDANTAPTGAAVLSSATYEALVPTFSLSAGGFGDAGKLFAGSQILVSPSATIGSFSQVGLCTYSSAIQGMYDWYNSTIDTSSYIDTMDKINGTYTHYYVLNRTQDVQVDLTNSLDPEETNTATAIADAQTAFNNDVTLQFGVTKLQNGYSGAFDKDESWGDDNPFEDEPEAQAWSIDGTDGTYLYDNGITNLQYIFFKSADPKDMITINGTGYISGDDGVKIWLTEAMLNMSTITIGYYASDYQSTPTTQKITMDSSYLYVDYSGDGKINGSFDSATNLFVLDSTTKDQLVMYIDPYTDYEESIFAKEAVYKTDGSGDVDFYAEKFIITKYTMNARAIQVPEGEDEDTKTQVLPSFISDATSQNPLYSSLSTEQKTYRYITSGVDETGGYTSDDRERYGATATAMQVIIIPCGGDESPVEQTEVGTPSDGDGTYYSYEWNPKFEGNLLYSFDNPSAITIPHSLAGDDIQLAVGSLENGVVTYSETEKAQLNGYLGSFVYIDTFALTVREQVETTADILGQATATSEVTGVEDEITQNADSTVIFSGGLRENSDYLQNMEAADAPGSDVDTADSGTGGDMFDMDLGVSLPSLDIPMFADWLTIVLDDQSVGFSIGIDLGGYESTSSKQSTDSSYTTDSGRQNTKTQIKDAFEAVKSFTTGNTNDASYNGAKNAPAGDKMKGFESHTFSVGVTVQVGMMFTYNNLTGNYEFDTCTVALSVELTYKYQYRFVSVPVLYVYIQVSGSIDIGVGLGVDYIEQSLGWDLIAGVTATTDGYTYKSETLAIGDELSFNTNYDGVSGGDFRAFNITFRGELYLGTDDTDIRSGVISSDGSEPMTIVLTKDSDNIPDCTVTLTATEGTIISKIDPVTEPVSRVYFTGLEISPEVGVELGVGIGIEVLKIELFANVGVSATFIVGGYQRDPDDMSASYESWVDAFAFAVGLGLRIVAIIINIEIDLVNYNIEYSADDVSYNSDGWSFYGSAFNGALEFSEGGEPVYVKVTLAGNPADSQTVYLPNNDNITAFAYQPTDNTNVPFEYSGYSGSGDAFKLMDGVQTGYDYQVVSTDDGRNFVIYTLGRDGYTKATQSMMLVMSEILVTNYSGDDIYGLVHPNNYTSTTNYIVIDNDTTSDLGFNAWAEGDTVHVAWVSYTTDAVETEEAGGTATDIGYATAKQTVVKTASMDTAGTTNVFENHETLSTAGNAVSLPRGDGDVVVYAEATHYTAQELATLKTTHTAHTAELFKGYTDSSFSEFVESSKELSLTVYSNLWNLSGQSSTLNAVVDGVPLSTGIATSDGQIVTDMEMVEYADGAYYVAYTTQQFAYENNDLITTTRLYLVGLDETTGFGDVKLLRTVVDSALDDTFDGVYSSGSLIENGAYQSPYISSLSFLNGKIGDKLTNEEPAMMADVDAEDFLLFEMNGTTYILKNEDLALLTDDTDNNDGDAVLYPFFQSDDGSPTGRLDVTIGADSQGNVAAVYTSTVEGSLGNALYISAYDPDDGSWSDGTILAMRGLQIYEDSAQYNWSVEELRYAYLYADEDSKNLLDGYTNEYGTLDQFTFSNVQIAMGSNTSRNDNIELLGDNASVIDIIGEDTLKRFGYDTDGAMTMSDALTEELWLLAEALDTDQNELLILTQGSMVKLTDTTDTGTDLTYAKDDGTGRISVSPDYSSSETHMGIYAINFGFGDQAVGNESLSFTYSNYTVGSVLNSYISFTNTGDTAIRASEQNPTTVNLYVSTTGDDTLLASWNITENVKSGASVALSGATIALPSSLTTGDSFYFTVSEDADYLGVENAFSYSSATSATGSITVEEKAELAVENLTVTPQSINAGGTMTAAVSFDITNRGSKEADNIYVQFAYESGRDSDGVAVYAPFDLTDHTLVASNAMNIETVDTLVEDNLTGGVLNISTISPDYTSNIAASQYRHVEGTIEVEAENFAGIAGELSLKVEVASDETATVSRMSDSVTISGHDEYNTTNNSDYETLTHMTTFTAPSQIVMAMGNTARVAVSAINTTGTTSVLVAMEAQESSDSTSNLGICYYDSASGTIVIVPSSEGTGKINLTDVATNQTYAIDFTVTSESDGINIFSDNAIFAFYNDQDVLYVEGDAEYVGWDFVEGSYWGYDSDEGQPIIPVNSDYVSADAGSYFTFTSVAENISLVFSGSIEVYSTYDGSVQRFESDGSSAVEIDFGNTTGATHIITITATANDTIFDTVAEDFTSTGTPTPSEDKTAPQIYWSRSFPDTASILDDGQTEITLTAYVLDDTGLASILVNNIPPDNIVEYDSGYWSFDLAISENGTYTVTARDTGGTSATQTFTVDWFADPVSGNTVSTAPTVSADLYKNDDTAITTGTFLEDGETAYLEVTASSDVTATTVKSYVIVTTDGVNGWATTPLEVNDSKTDVPNNGYYEVYVETGIGTWARTFVKMSAIDSGTPVVVATFDEKTSTLTFSATKEADGGDAATLQSLSVNGEPLATDIDSYTYTGSYAITLDGAYSFTITDDAGKTSTLNVSVTGKFPVSATPALISDVDGAWNANLDNGSFVLNESVISGGQYDATASTIDIGDYVATYQYTVVNVNDDFTASDVVLQAEDTLNGWLATKTWTVLTVDGTATVSNLDAGTYAVYIQSENGNLDAVRQEVTIADESLSITSVSSTDCTKNLQDGTITITAEGGKDSTGLYQFAYTELTTTQEADGSVTPNWVDVSSMTNWMYFTGDTAVFTEVLNGDYQVAVRMAENVTDTTAIDSANTTYATALATLESFESETEDGYAAALEAYETAKTALETQQVAIATIVDGAYTSDPTLWKNAAIDMVTVGLYTPPSTGASSYTSSLSAATNGTVTLSGSRNTSGATVTITAEPDDGYQVGNVTVTYSSGREVTVTDNGDGTYSYIQPGASVTVTVTFVPIQDGATNPFTDVVETAYYYDAVLWAVENGITNGVTDTTFEPNTVCTRAQAVTFLWRANGSPTVSTSNPFTDVDSDKYYYQAVLWAVENGITNGTTDTTFSPNDICTRGQIVTFLWRMIDQTTVDADNPFMDVIDGKYYYDAVLWAVENAITNGTTDSTFAPTADCTRGHIVTFLYRNETN